MKGGINVTSDGPQGSAARCPSTTSARRTNISKSTYRIEDAQQALTLRKVSTPNYRYMLHRMMGIAPEEYNDMEYDLSEHSRIIDTEAL